MSAHNRALAARWFDDVWNRRLTTTIDELMAPDAVGHMEGAEVRGPDEFKAAREVLVGAFPDLQVVVEDVLSDDKHAVVRWRATGTHRGDHFGFPASLKPVTFRGLTWLTIKDGRIVEGWDAWNQQVLIQSIAPA